MKVVFLSNYYNHHQKSFCESIYSKIAEDFKFIATRIMGDNRRELGYEIGESPSYVEYAYLGDEHKSKCIKLVDEADVVIVGSVSDEYRVNKYIRNKIYLFYSERLYKQGFQYYKWPVRFLKFWKQYSMKKNHFLLCASAYTSADFAITGNFINKAYKWGYFPKTIYYDIDNLMSCKDRKKILWCGRLIDWKHPENIVEVATQLKQDGYDFLIECIGTGSMKSKLEKAIFEKGLENNIIMLGAMKPYQVRKHMEKAGIFFATSDFQEGWGAVINESMNSGCALVASHAMGAVPYLVSNNTNGLIYKYRNNTEMYNCIRYLLDNPHEQVRLGEAAYYSITTLWNAEVAAERFIKFIEEIKDHGYCDLYKEGPCSKADIIKNNWYGGN